MTAAWPNEHGQQPAIIAQTRDGVAVLTLNRPSSLNAWTPAMGTLYFDTLERVTADPSVRAILVMGAGRAFCAGADMSGLSHIASTGGLAQNRDPRRYWYAMSIGKPIVAAIHGPCLGVGLQQALCCDVRFAAADAQIAAPYAKRGLIGEVGITWMLSRIAGVGHAMDLLVSGRTIGAREALAMGIVNQVFEPEDLFPRALEYCAKLAVECSPWSMRMLKQQVYHDLMTALPSAFDRSEQMLNEALAGQDFADAIAAFRQKRAHTFAPLSPQLARLDPWPEGRELSAHSYD